MVKLFPSLSCLKKVILLMAIIAVVVVALE
jgi:hypothetical protein